MSKDIKLIALDLDGTTLDSGSKITDENLRTLEAASEKGIHVVVCTGRVWNSLPDEIFKMKNLEYVVTSNGATVTELSTGKRIYESNIDPQAVEEIIEVIRNEDISVDISVRGQAYIDSAEYFFVKENGCGYRSAEYLLRTREPVDGLYDFAMRNIEHVENVNMIFKSSQVQRKMEKVLMKSDRITVTSSMRNNLEIGGENTSKADALLFLLDKLGLTRKNLLACGDSPNDLEMLQLAEIGVVMGNADEHMKNQGDYITLSNDESGVAHAVKRFVMRDNDEMTKE
ncbi:hypothetical protein AXF21_02095 [Eubacterium minutum ATCC 700079]|nr:hypothetical protein AXF21_02095 [Eubacterium minutum ATCC 700079]